MEQGPAAGLVGGGGAPAGDVWRGKVEKLQGKVGEGAVRSVWAAEGRREELHGSRRPAAALCCGGGSTAREEGCGRAVRLQ